MLDIEIFINLGASLILGIVIALVYMFRNTYNKQFVITLALIPIIVQAIIMLVNGSIGTGIAVMGAFSLVRFRSVPGNAKDIGSIFFAMAVGLAAGTGYILFAVLFTVLVGAITIILNITKFGEQKQVNRELKITIPENLNYPGLFDDIFEKYTRKNSLVKVKTSNMGSLYQLHYHITLNDETEEKTFIDALRCRNGNLDIICGHASSVSDVL
jgi:uncharacterized membrane protein YhiD involved in acid resistance